jgi:hypothetical protein
MLAIIINYESDSILICELILLRGSGLLGMYHLAQRTDCEHKVNSGYV